MSDDLRPDDRRHDDRRHDEDVAEAVLAVDGVVDLHAGVLDTVTAALPGRVPGVEVADDRVYVHVVCALGTALPPAAARIVAAVQALPGLADTPVDVFVEDVTTIPADPGPHEGEPS